MWVISKKANTIKSNATIGEISSIHAGLVRKAKEHFGVDLEDPIDQTLELPSIEYYPTQDLINELVTRCDAGAYSLLWNENYEDDPVVQGDTFGVAEEIEVCLDHLMGIHEGEDDEDDWANDDGDYDDE